MDLNNVFDGLEAHGYIVSTVPYVYTLYRVMSASTKDFVDIAYNDDNSITCEHYIMDDGHRIPNEDATFNEDTADNDIIDWIESMI